MLLLLVIVSSARAQLGGFFNGNKNDDVTIDKAEFGFGGLVPVEQWTPMTVWLTGGPKGFSGVMIVEYAQDATQMARIITPAAATPGVSAPVQATVCLPSNLGSVTLELIDQNGKTKARRTLSNSGSPGDGPLTYEPCEGQTLIGVLEPASAAKAFRRANDASGSSRASWYNYSGDTNARREYRGAVIDPEVLPTNWSAYSGLSALVVPTESLRGTNISAIRAVQTWVSGGGRLVLLVPTAGDNWRRWLGEGAAGLFELEEPARHDTPITLANAVRVAGVGVPANDEDARGNGSIATYNGRPITYPDIPGSPKPTLERPAGFDPQPAPRVLGRAVRLTPTGVAEGWQVRWPVHSPEKPGPVGLIAEGPVGMGWVAIVGVEPQTSSQVSATPVIASVWADALRVAAQRGTGATRTKSGNTWQQVRSGPDPESRAALHLILDSLSTVPPIGVGVFFGILACLVLLAFLVGPFDALVLKRLRLQHFSWLSAVLWVLIASLGAFLIPSYLRSARTQVNRACITDIVMDEPGSPKRRGVAWTSGVTGIFAGSRGELTLRDTNDAAWWRGISATAQYQELKPRGFPPIQTVQRPGLIAGEPGNVPESLWLGQWTFRTTQDDGPSSSGPRAVLTRDAGAWTVTVTDLPDGASIASARLAAADRAVKFDLRENATPTQGRWSATSSVSDPANVQRAPDASSLAELVAFAHGNDPAFAATDLLRPAGRSLAIAHRLASGKWAMLALAVTGGPHDPNIGPDADYGQTRAFRLLIPLDQDQSVAPFSLTTPPIPDFPRVPMLEDRVPRTLGVPPASDFDNNDPPQDLPQDPPQDPATDETSTESDRPDPTNTPERTP